jgi:integrase
MASNIVKRGDVYYLRLQHKGKRYLRSTGAANMADARAWATAFRRRLQEGRMDLLDASRMRQDAPTIQQVIDAYRAAAATRDLRPATAATNIGALLTVLGLSDDGARTARATAISASAAESYAARIMAAATDHVRARRTICSTLNQARALFARWTPAAYRALAMPDASGFLGWRPGWRQPAVRYRLPPDELVRATETAGAALRTTDPSLYVAYRLCHDAGLRASEAAAARWDWIRQADGRIWLDIGSRPGEWRAKHDGARAVPIHADLYADLRSIGGGDYIIPADTATARRATLTRRLAAWMRHLGWTRDAYPKAAHELRKLCGSRWYTELGAEVAQRWLGHADIATTCRYYADLTRQPMPLDVR